MKEEQQKSSAAKKVMSDRDFKKFLDAVQDSAVCDQPMPRMSDKKPANKAGAKSATMAGSKRPAAKAGIS